MQEKRIGDWIQTYTGKVFYPLDPREDEIDIIDVAHALSLICRFTGHCFRHHSVGQHSVLISRMCKTHKLWGLLHDLPEFAMSDLSRPLKRSAGFETYVETEKKFMDVVCKKFGLALGMPAEVKEADDRMLITERNQLMTKPPKEWSDKYEPYDIIIDPWSPERAEKEFLEEFNRLYINK